MMSDSFTSTLYFAVAALFTLQCHANPNSDCHSQNADSTCVSTVQRSGFHPPPILVLYDGPIANVPANGSAYWGFDFVAASAGVPSPVPRNMFINRSSSPISLTFTFDLPSIACGSGCRPGMEFKLNNSWDSFFPNIIVSGTQAITSLLVAPGQAYGFVISLWMASNPRLKVENIGAASVFLPEVGLTDLSIATPIQGNYYQCTCSDGVVKTCYSGTRYSNGLIGGWYQDRYIPWDAIGCN